MIISTKDNYAIEGNYAIYSKDLKLIKNANVKIYHKGKLILNKTINEDDNFAYFIEAAYRYFNKVSTNPDLIDISSFSNIMNLYCDNLMERKKI